MSKIEKKWASVPKWIKYTLYTILGLAGAFLLGLLFGNIVRWLWNWLMPGLFNLRAIGFWEGLGLFVLARILFGGFGDSAKHRKATDEEMADATRGARCHEHKKAKRDDEGRESWEYYDDWWDEDGKAAFRAYAERMKKKPEPDESTKTRPDEA